MQSQQHYILFRKRKTGKIQSQFRGRCLLIPESRCIQGNPFFSERGILLVKLIFHDLHSFRIQDQVRTGQSRDIDPLRRNPESAAILLFCFFRIYDQMSDPFIDLSSQFPHLWRIRIQTKLFDSSGPMPQLNYLGFAGYRCVRHRHKFIIHQDHRCRSHMVRLSKEKRKRLSDSIFLRKIYKFGTGSFFLNVFYHQTDVSLRSVIMGGH